MLQQRPGLRITKLLIHETGTYNQQYRRPYVTNLEAGTLNALSERLNGADKLMPSMMAGVANQFIAPSATPEKEVGIVGGWGERRMRFMMEVEHVYATGVKITEVILGYTNYAGITVSGAVDPRMEFFVNSTLQVRNSIERTPMGNQTYSSVVDSSHVLADNNFTGLYTPEKDQRMRPEDVYSLMSRSHIPDMGNTLDMRTTLTNQAVKSRRSNSQAANYMAGILDNYKNATATSEFGQGAQEILNTARGYAAELPAARDPFLMAISQIRGTAVGNTFSYGDLRSLDPNVDAMTAAVFMQETQRAQTHSIGQTQLWGGADRDTSVATILSQSVPSLLMDLMLTRIVFKSSNRFIGGEVQTHVFDAQGFSNVDLSEFVRLFQIRLAHEILKDITYDNQVDFAIEMRVDLLGETWIGIEFDNHPRVDFVTPSFCDALTVPVLTSNQEASMTLARDFDMLFETVQNNTSPAAGGNPIGVFGQL